MKNISAKNLKKNLKVPGIRPRRQSPKRLALELVILICIILLAISSYLWWTRIVMDPQRTLNDALAKNLKTRSIVKSVNQSGPTGGINQVTYLSFFPESAKSRTDTVLTQGIASNSTSVTTQTIGTSAEDYVRYTDVKGGNGLQGVDRLQGLLGTWSKREQNLSKGEQVSFLNESLFGVIPFGYFNDAQKDQLLETINQKNIYKYTSVKKQFEDKRPVYVYEMSINPADLVGVIKEYIRLGGAGDSSQLDPSQYKGLGDVRIKLTIDILSRQITKVEYSTGRVENYSGQNLYQPIDIPTDTIPVEELQRRLQGQSA